MPQDYIRKWLNKKTDSDTTVSYTHLIHIKTEEKEWGSIHYELELFFQDTDDTFAGHFLYAAIEDSKVKEITLMG